MNITAAPFAVLRFQYRIARFPLQVIEDRVIARMGSEAPARLFYERSLGLLDAAVGNALRDSRLRMRGDALADRSEALGRAAKLDATAEQTRQQSAADLKAKGDKAVEDQQDAREAKERAVKEARSSADERKRAAQDEAAQRTAAAKKQADDIAARRKNSVESAKREEQAAIRAEEQRVAAAAKSKLDDAESARNKADVKRAQADRVEELADVEKRKRQAARANKD
jgi:hypothetical protein